MATIKIRGRRIRIGMLGFDGANGLDLFGPLEAFSTARRPSDQQNRAASPYEVMIAGPTMRPFTTEAGALLQPHCTYEELLPLDTLIVAGGPGLREPPTNKLVAQWLRQNASRVRRVASVCTGLYGLAPTGLVDGLRVTTHWRYAQDVAERFPPLIVDANALFIKQGKYYTCGGITAGIDLALALIEEDLGPQAALAVAREMNVYLKRSGGQAQYSEPLRFQTRAADRFADLVAWISAHLHGDLSVEVLAARACLSPRQFSRRFTAAFDCTPADFVETLRLSEALERLTSTDDTIDSIAASTGFGSADVFRRRFAARFGIAPRDYRERFSAAAAA